MILFGGVPIGRFYPVIGETRTFALPVVELECEIEVTNLVPYQAHSRIVSHVEAFEAFVGDTLVAYVFKASTGDVKATQQFISVIRPGSLASLLSDKSFKDRPPNKKSIIQLVLRNPSYLVYDVNNVATLIVANRYSTSLDPAISNVF